MRIAISESQLRMLNEVHKDHPLDELVNFDHIDFKYEYRKLNELLFDGLLPVIEIRWDKSKHTHGVTKITRNKYTGQVLKVTMAISNFYDVTYRMFRDTLAHEMIHVWQATNNIREANGNHGPKFIQQMNRINGMNLGFDIKISEDLSDLYSKGILKVSAKHKPRKLYVAVIDLDNSRTIMGILSPSCYTKDEAQLGKLYAQTTKKGKHQKVEGTIYETEIADLLAFSINNSLRKSLSFMEAPDDILNQIKQQGKIVNRFVSQNGETDWETTPHDEAPAPKQQRPGLQLPNGRFISF